MNLTALHVTAMGLCGIIEVTKSNLFTLVFGWYLSSYAGLEQDDEYAVLAGYLKGGDQAGFDLKMNIKATFNDASKHY